MPHSSKKTREFIKQYWFYFRTLEDDFIATERYVTLDKDNYETFSVEYNRLYQSVCSEVDVVAKKLCEILGGSNANDINEYREIITKECSKLALEEVLINDTITEVPWESWAGIDNGNPNNPIWWRLYNKVKHNRQSTCTDKNTKYHNKPFYKCATQQNVLSSLSGLYVLEFYTLLLICKNDCNETDDNANSIYNSMLPIFSSKLFQLKSWEYCKMEFMGGEFIDKNVIEKKIVEHEIML